MKILLTGERGIGKSTILQKVGDSFKGDLYGILSKEIRDKKGERVGFKAVNPDKESKVFAHRFNIQSKFVLNNKYKIDVKVIDSFVIPELKKGIGKKKGLILLDEIGRMQCFSKEFLATVKGLFESDLNLLATIVYEDEPWSIEFKRNSNTVLVEVTKENRNKLSEILLLIFSNNKVFDKLNKYQKIKVYEILRKYFKEDKFIQIFKLFNNAIHYVAEKRIIELEEKKRFKVNGRSKERKVIFDVKNGCFNCDCDLFIGKGKYKGSRGECSHVQAVQIF